MTDVPTEQQHPPRSGEKRSGVLSQGLLSVIAHGITSVATFFAVIGIVRHLGAESWGQFSLAIQITVFSSMIADFGIGPVIMRRLAIEPERSGSIVADATVARLVLLLPTWLVTLGAGLALEPSWEFFLLLNVMLINTVISAKVPILRGTLDHFYRSQSRMGFPTLTMAIDSVVLLLLVLLLPGLFRDPLTAMALYTGSNILGALIMAAASAKAIRSLNREAVRVSWASIRELLRQSWPLALYLGLNALHITIDSVYLKVFHGDTEVGLLNAALRILTPLAVFPTIVAISAAPFLARASMSERDDRRTKELFSLGLKTLIVGALFLSLFGAANARTLIELAFKQEYADAGLPMIILFITFLPMSLNIFLVEVNNARNMLKRNTVLAMVFAGVSVAAGPLLIIQHSVPGAAVSKLLAVMAGLVFILIATRRDIGVRLAPMLLKAAGLISLLAVTGWLVRDLHYLAANAVAVPVFVAGVFLLRFFSPDELRQWKEQIVGLFGRMR